MADWRGAVISLSYIVAAVLFIFGLQRLSSPRTARSGNRLAAVGMAIALAVTLLDRQIDSFLLIALGVPIGAIIGVYSARKVAMTAMPQMVALFNGAGGATAALISVAEYILVIALDPDHAAVAKPLIRGGTRHTWRRRREHRLALGVGNEPSRLRKHVGVCRVIVVIVRQRYARDRRW